MYARMLKFSANPDKIRAIENMTNTVYPFAKDLTGFKQAIYMLSQDDTEFTALTLWDSLEDAQEGAKALGREFGMTLGDLAVGPVSINLLKVYEPK